MPNVCSLTVLKYDTSGLNPSTDLKIKAFRPRGCHGNGAFLSFTEEMAKKKFKNLRDQFRLELKKVPEGRAGDPTLPPEAYLSSWPWFGMMFFLRDMIHRRAMMADSLANNGIGGRGAMTDALGGITIKRNYEDMESSQSDAYDEENSAFQDEVNLCDRLSVQFREQSVRPNGIKRSRDSGLQEYLAVEKQRLELLQRQQEEEGDSDRMFLLSLLAPMKTLEPRRAHMFRLKVQQLLYDAQYSQNFGK